MSCGSPDSMQNTTVTGRNFSIGGEIEYSCPVGHSLVGDAVRICQKNGVWSGHAPSCKCKWAILSKKFLLISKSQLFLQYRH